MNFKQIIGPDDNIYITNPITGQTFGYAPTAGNASFLVRQMNKEALLLRRLNLPPEKAKETANTLVKYSRFDFTLEGIMKAESCTHSDVFLNSIADFTEIVSMNQILLGFLFGETLRRSQKGMWQKNNRGLYVRLKDGSSVYPFEYALLHFIDGLKLSDVYHDLKQSVTTNCN